MSDWEAILRWYIVLTAASVAFFPLVSVLGSGLGAARVGLARPLGIVLLTAVVWWPAAVAGVPFNRWSLWMALLVAGVGLWAWWLKRPGERVSLIALVCSEAAWLLAFGGYALFRAYNPDIINTEKPMEIALLSSIVRSSDVPAPDPWLSGSTINYYYFGYQMFGAVIKMTAVEAAVGFNLALSTLFASTITAAGAAAIGLARGLGARRRSIGSAAVVAALLVVLAGNLETPQRLLTDTRGTIEAGWWDGVGWQASRIIIDHNVHDAGDTRATINEFPAFSFVLGDLHPHVMTYPLLAAVLALGIGFAQAGRGTSRAAAVVAGALIGVLYASNSWDAPLGLALLAGGIIVAGYRERREAAISIGLLVLGALVTVLPFLTHYTAPIGVANNELPGWLTGMPVIGTLANTFGIVYWKPSSAGELLTVHGLWLAAFGVYAIRELRRDRHILHWLRARGPYGLVAALLLLGVSVAWAPALILIALPMLLAFWIAMRATHRGTRTLAGLFALGFLLVLIPEFLFLQDVFLDRMNTVFKFYFQAWLLLAIASTAATVDVVRRSRGVKQWAVTSATVVAMAASLTYTPLSAWDWTRGFETRSGLDGSAYLARSAPGTLEAIVWIQTHAGTGDWLVEAPGCTYIVLEGAPMSRVSAFSGVPALIGWYGHQGQWRRGEEHNIYRTLDARTITANALLDGSMAPVADGPTFIIIGRQERFGAERCDKVTERPDDVEQRLIDSGWVIGLAHAQMTIFVPPWLAESAPER